MLIQYVTLLHIFMNGGKGRTAVLTIVSSGVSLEVEMAAAIIMASRRSLRLARAAAPEIPSGTVEGPGRRAGAAVPCGGVLGARRTNLRQH